MSRQPPVSAAPPLRKSWIASSGLPGWQAGSFALAAFLLSKSTMFFAPILLAQVIGVSSYGAFEYAMALASPLALLAGCGVVGAIPYFLIKRNRPSYLTSVQFHILLVGAIQALAVTLRALDVVSFTAYFVTILICTVVVQSLYATIYKVHGRLTPSFVMDSALYVVLFFLIVAYTAFGLLLDLNAIAIAFNLYGLACIGATAGAFPWRNNWRFLRRRYANLLRFGVPLILTSALFGLLATAGRILAGHLLSMEDVGIYSFFFRLAGGVILVHQLLTTVFFRSFYASEAAALDRYFARFLSIVFIAAMVGFLTLPVVLTPLLPIFARLAPANLPLYHVLSFQMVFWVGMALAEMISIREGLAKEVIVLLAVTLGVFGVSVYFLVQGGLLTLMTLAQAHMFAIFFCLAGQLWLLARRGHRLPRAALASVIFLIWYFTSTIQL